MNATTTSNEFFYLLQITSHVTEMLNKDEDANNVKGQ
jgi:hypothetical protein